MTQKDSALKIGVVGAGAIGGICAGWIKNAGYDVRVAVRTPEHARQIMEEGIQITGIKGDLTIKMDAVSRVEDMDGDRDMVLLGVKATEMMEAAEKLKAGLKPGAMVVSLQNGFCEEALAGVLGRETVVGCVTGWGATLHSPCRLEMTSPGDFIVGNIDNRPDPRLEEVRAVLDNVLPTKISNNIAGDLYSKLIINSCITSVGAVCGLYLGQMLSRQKARLIFLRIMEEAMAVAKAMGVEVEVFAGKLDYYRFLEKKGFFADLKRHLFLRALGFKYRRLKSSSLQSLERGKKTEIDYLTGFITSNALRFNISTPVNTQVLKMVKKIEQGKARIASENLDKIIL
jgi:2-dehydropantoate 2-reductase